MFQLNYIYFFYINWYLKLQTVSFASLWPSLFVFAELSLLRGLCSGTVSARINLIFWGECVAVTHRTGVDTVLQDHRF